MSNREQVPDFESTVKSELAVLYRVARRMGASPDESEDLVQITLIKAFQAWERFDGRHLRSWLIRILRNERLMMIRSDRNEQSLDEPYSAEVADEPFWNELSWKLQADRILEELEELPEIYKMAIHLCDVEQMSYDEAAALSAMRSCGRFGPAMLGSTSPRSSSSTSVYSASGCPSSRHMPCSRA